ncbi:MAG: putative porin [Flavobacteriaceae bacterium]|nr:putative porin [Flavobacteriaceae bacterium]
MSKKVFFIFFFLTVLTQAQIINRPIGSQNMPSPNERDSVINDRMLKIKLSGKTHYTDYKVISNTNDTTYIDTTLTLKKYYKFNFLRKDEFGLLPFSNMGQTYNALSYDFYEPSLFPDMGARASQYNYYGTDAIYYYEVPTPTTELMYRTGMQQGQVLDALFTFNTSKRHNYSIAYKGLRSIGKYNQALTSQGNLRITFSYHTKNDRYYFRSHIAAQDLTNEQNGGLTEASITYFEDRDPNFTDRARLETNFTDAKNSLRGNRYFIDHSFNIWQHKDSLGVLKSYLRLGHNFVYERKHHGFSQTTVNTSFFGDYFTSPINDQVTFSTAFNQAYLALKSPIVLGELKFKSSYYSYDYKFNETTFINNTLIPSAINGDILSVGGEWNTSLKKFNIHADAATLVSGNLTGNYLKGSAEYKQDSLFTFRASLLVNSRSPNLNFIVNQSDYFRYNWYENRKNERYRVLAFDLISDKILNAHVSLNQIDNYTYFTDNSAVAQADKTVNYLKVKVSKEFRLGKFSLDNTVMYQRVAQGESFLRVPELVTRNTFYFSDYVFKGDPLYLQTGISFNYFSSYYLNRYDPLLSEFTIQNDRKIGGYPVFDFFINAQVQRTRLYLKAEHINSTFGKANYFSAPAYPYRDFIIRFGLVWNFFI